ncbi:MAG: zinc ABC transporter substrate-binding protein [Candidatus Omnitrophica bacterium]|nr:zinc ABC transporter substrate-binding protein [Candidatus Omnitrophota bacterium]
MLLGIITVFLLCSTTTVLAQEPAASKIKAVATFSILADMVKNVGGDRVEMTVLVGPNGDPHTFEPAPQDNIALLQAQVIFENGLHFDPWLDKLVQASGAKARRVAASEGVELIRNGDETDPHIWQDVSNAMVMVEHVREGLTAVDSAHADYYREHAETYLAELAGLDHWIIDTLKDIPDQSRQLVTSHDTFGYFAKRYGFKVIGAVIGSATTEAADPSAAQIAGLIEKIKSTGVKTLFVENTYNPKILQAIAAEAGVKVAPELYTDALGGAGSDGETYVEMMEHNAKILAGSLK